MCVHVREREKGEGGNGDLNGSKYSDVYISFGQHLWSRMTEGKHSDMVIVPSIF